MISPLGMPGSSATSLLALPETVRGLPLHVLVIHAVVVLVPLAAFGALLCAARQSARRYFGALVVLAAAASVVLVPIATGSGENLARQLSAQELVKNHVQWGQRMLPATIVLLLSVLILVTLDIARRTSVAAPAPSGADAPQESDVPHESSGGVRTAVRTERSTAQTTGSTTALDRWIGARLPQAMRTAAAELWLRRAETAFAVISALTALVTLYVCFQTGETGATAVWSGR
jgi:hypothetical protein